MEDRRPPRPTLADLAMAAIAPVLIIGMISCLVFFLVNLLYRGDFTIRLMYLLGLYTFGSVFIARIAIEQSRSVALGYTAALGLATYFVVMRFVRFSGPLQSVADFLVIGFLVLIGFLADRITWDCTWIDERAPTSPEGLLQSLGLVRSTLNRKDRKQATRRHNPGIWVLYFALLAIPLFGLGQLAIPAYEAAARQRAILFLFGYLLCALSLLVVTSFLGIRRYLRRRNIEMPAGVTSAWLLWGVGSILAVLLAVWLLPLPSSGPWAAMGKWITSPDNLIASRFGWGPEPVRSSSPGNPASTPKTNTGPQKPSGPPQANGSAESPAPPGESSTTKNLSQQPSSQQPSTDPSSTPSASTSQQGQSQQGQGQQGQGQQGQGQQGQGQQGQGQQGQGQQGQGQQGQGQQGQGQQGQGQQGQGQQGQGQQGQGQQGQGQQGQGQQGQGQQGQGQQGQGQQGQGQQGQGQQGQGQQGQGQQGQGQQGQGQQGQGQQGQGQQGQGQQGQGQQGQGQQGQPNRAESPSSPPSSSGSNWRMPELPNVLSWMRPLLIAVLSIFLLIFAAMNMRRFFAWWGSLSQVEAGDVGQQDKETPPIRSFASYVDPFAKNLQGWTEKKVVTHSFEALEAWGREHDAARQVDETAESYAERLARRFQMPGGTAELLATQYNRVLFGKGRPARSELAPLANLWRWMQGNRTAEAVPATASRNAP